MSDTIIRVENLGKKYQLGRNAAQDGARYRTLRDTLADGARNLFRRNGTSPTTEEFWALRDVSFEVKQGEVVGIIGRNGAGKSTLLKILSRITEPTTGKISIKGRVASLLEVGTGFHPELTGRENIFLNGAVLGMTRAEIKAKFDEIVAFAEVEKFLDTPVKRYSSGMYVRLAFAVAAHLEPEILVVDEVLAVGDAEFQNKCLGKMQDVSRHQGRTVLFVSHNMPAVARLTKRSLVLTAGRIIVDGSTAAAVEHYLTAGLSGERTSYDLVGAPRPFGGTEAAMLQRVRFLGTTAATFGFGDDFQIEATVAASIRITELRFSMTICSTDGVPVGSSSSRDAIAMLAGETCALRMRLPTPNLAPGRYYCIVAVGSGFRFEERVDFDIVPDVLHFEVTPVRRAGGAVSYWNDNWGRVVLPAMEMEFGDSSTVVGLLPPAMR